MCIEIRIRFESGFGSAVVQHQSQKVKYLFLIPPKGKILSQAKVKHLSSWAKCVIAVN